MSLFHLIPDAHAILSSKGVYRQCKVFRRGNELYAGYGAGFVRLYQHGTSAPSLNFDEIVLPEGVDKKADVHGRLSVVGRV
ncbi:MAG: hypothetical protein AB7S41_08960 [Parvibaculaceae bacterium]